MTALGALFTPTQADETPAPSPAASASAGATSSPPDADYYIAVQLLDSSKKAADGTSGVPVPDVKLTVVDDAKADVGSSVTDAEGRVYIPIDGGGKYTVELDEDSLPDGVKLSGSASTTKTVQVFLEGATNVQFQIGVTAVKATPFLTEFSQAMFNGIKYGLIIALAGLGLSLVFGTTGLTNFAHGELITFGAIAAYVFNRGFGLPVIIAGILAVVASAALGWIQDKGLWGPLRKRGTGLIAMMIVSIGLALLVRSLFQYFFGGSTRTYSEYVAQGPNKIGSLRIADKELAIVGIAIIVIVVTCILLARTRLGKAMRAVADNPALAASSGMRVDSVITAVWVLGTALTGLSGVLYAVDKQVSFVMGFKILLLVFAAVTLGGLGTIWGAILGSLIIGIVDEVGPVFGVPASIKDVGPLLVLVLILLVRPQGLLGKAQRIG
ncbi:hypothetical protein ASD11_05600 [Aeromicrobium sp. Root495]|nr:hypothetical protein ASD11_05600 [Aeromicrobium sp. Root495]